jgi:hypothetical protein
MSISMISSIPLAGVMLQKVPCMAQKLRNSDGTGDASSKVDRLGGHDLAAITDSTGVDRLKSLDSVSDTSVTVTCHRCLCG